MDIFDPTIEDIFRKQLKIGGETVVMAITDTGDANVRIILPLLHWN